MVDSAEELEETYEDIDEYGWVDQEFNEFRFLKEANEYRVED